MPPTRSAYVRARQMRQAMSLPETLLWRYLRGSPAGVKFRRQHPVGPYIADFYAPVAKLIVEIDGASHRAGERPTRDERRDIWLAQEGYHVIRITASDVLANPAQIAEAAVQYCAAMGSEKGPAT